MKVDLRRHNSWMMRLHEVSSIEMAEVFAINSIAPAILNAKLKPLMEKNMKDLKFIVNVSAMEGWFVFVSFYISAVQFRYCIPGKFYRYKSDKHPHTNMAKAALNMMTITSAQDYAKSNIYI